MPAITSVTPTSSIQTGNIPVLIEGSNFLTSDVSSHFSNAPFYVPQTENGGVVSSPFSGGVNLSVSSALDNFAGVTLNTTFDIAFDVTIKLNTNVGALPAVDGAVLFGLRMTPTYGSPSYFDLAVRYSDSIGYYVVMSKVFSLGDDETYQRSIGPYNISALRLVRSQNEISAYVQIGNDMVEVGHFDGIPEQPSKIIAYISNSPTYHTAAFSIRLQEFIAKHAVSLAGLPANVKSATDTAISVTTYPGSPRSGPVWIGFPDGTAIDAGAIAFNYTAEELVQRISFISDMAISVYAEYANPTRQNLFTQAGGFTWDEDEFLAEGRGNNNLYIPSLWDPRTYSVPLPLLQSGHGFEDNIEHLDIVRLKRESQEKWHARLNHGSYFIRNVSYYLFSDESVTTRLESGETEDGRSLKNLLYLPKPGIPISVSSLQKDIRSGNIVEFKRFQKRQKFTGKVSNGIELDTEFSGNIDKKFQEFIVHYNSNNMYSNWRIPVPSVATGIYTFFLPEVPLFEYPVIFTRKDIFKSQKYVAKKYGDPDAIFGEFKYGTGVQQPGDWTVDYNSGEVTVWLDQDYYELGFTTFTFDYPATLEFNNNYLVDKGYGITNPVVSDLSELDFLGESNGQPSQFFTAGEFPIYDMSAGEFFDQINFKLFIYDPANLSFDTSWTRVKSFAGALPSDKVYVLDPDSGEVSFGNGINGKIPSKYHRILAGYKVSLRIEYEPVSSVNHWTGKSVDLNLSRNNLNSGFLHLTRREQIPDNITLEFSDGEISALEHSTLTATVYDLEGEPMPAVDVEFTIEANAGVTEDEFVTSDSNGQASTIYMPNSSIESMGIFVQLYKPGADLETVGDYIDGAHQDNGSTTNGKIIAPEAVVAQPGEIYLFKILDDGDAFNRYDNQTRKGGTYQVYYKEDGGVNTLIRPSAVSGRVLIFDEPLPQSHDPSGPNYEPNLRGFCIIAVKQVRATAQTTYRGITIKSQTAYLRVGYSPIQKGEWTLPILPVNFDGSEITRATYITINP